MRDYGQTYLVQRASELWVWHCACGARSRRAGIYEGARQRAGEHAYRCPQYPARRSAVTR